MKRSKNLKTIIEEEWTKVKDFNIFNDKSELEQLLIQNPEGRCFRKYTSYPWSKENFFFGPYKELVNFYKTSTELPFYLKEYIGKKYYKLTIKSFLCKIENNKRVIYANCACECGNEIEVNFDSILKNNKRHCGHCNDKKKSIYSYFPYLVNERWDYEKNVEDPHLIDAQSDKLYWWKGYKDSYQMAPRDLFRKNAGTSFPEQAILFYIKQNNIIVKNRYKINIENKKYEADMYLPEYKIAIEYDGVHWHKNKLSKDVQKSTIFEKNGIHCIRVRESGLPKISIKNVDVVECNIEDESYFEAIVNSINQVLTLLSAKISNKLNDLKLIDVEDLKNNQLDIQGKYFLSYKENSVANCWLINHWSNTNKISPQFVDVDSHIPYDFICMKKNIISISPHSIRESANYSLGIHKEYFEKHFGYSREYCPFVSHPHCPCNNLYNLNKTACNCEIFKNKYKTTLSTIPYDVTQKNFIKALNYYRQNKSIKNIKDALQDLLKYKNNTNNQELIDKLINSKKLSSSQKLELIENSLDKATSFLNTPMSILQSHVNLMDFYFKTKDYNKILSESNYTILDLENKEYLFALLIKFIKSKSKKLLHSILIILNGILDSQQIDRLLYSTFAQIIIKSPEFIEKSVKNNTGYSGILDLLNSYLSNSNTTQLILECFKQSNKSIGNYIKKQTIKIYNEHIINRIKNNEPISIDLYCIFMNTENKYEFNKWFIDLCLQCNIRISQIIIKGFKTINDSQNIYRYILELDKSQTAIGQTLIRDLIKNRISFIFDYSTDLGFLDDSLIIQYLKTIKKHKYFFLNSHEYYIIQERIISSINKHCDKKVSYKLRKEIREI